MALVYEPFYDFDRYFGSFFNDAPHRVLSRAAQNSEATDGAIRALKPRYLFRHLPTSPY